MISVHERYLKYVHWMILMVKLAYSKSQKWYSERCCYCDKKLKDTEVRVRGTATFLNGVKVNVLYHEQCAYEVRNLYAIEQIKRGEFGSKEV